VIVAHQINLGTLLVVRGSWFHLRLFRHKLGPPPVLDPGTFGLVCLPRFTLPSQCSSPLNLNETITQSGALVSDTHGDPYPPLVSDHQRSDVLYL
jgi:hypothetical protein